MIVIKRRLIFWLLRAYFKRWGRIVTLCFFLGLIIFFILKTSFPYIIAAFTGVSRETDGIVGTYTIKTIPTVVTKDLSHGLTSVDSQGLPKPDVANSWEIKDSGKTYVFHIKRGLSFVDGTPVTSSTIQYSFSDVKIDRPDVYTITFHLKDSYSPFLISVSQPIFKEGLIGLGPYSVRKIQTNGAFLESITLASSTSTPALKIYTFYPTADSLKVAFALGEITVAQNISDITFQDTSLQKFPHTQIIKSTNYQQLVTLFYNTQDKDLSDKKLRDGLSYALPNSFPGGERAVSSIPPYSFAFNSDLARLQDFTHAKLLFDASLNNAPPPHLTITTLASYKKAALIVSDAWKKIGVTTDIKIVDSLPQFFQIYLGDFNVPNDPDQYTLWHSFQGNNITGFKSARIDKLLEDGRKTIDEQERVKTYQDFQKYLQDEQPASFLYFPYTYSVSRK